MTVKFKDLIDFIRKLKEEGYGDVVGDDTMRLEIKKKWGFSPYVEKSRLEALVQAHLIKYDNGVWRILYTMPKRRNIKYNEGEIA